MKVILSLTLILIFGYVDGVSVVFTNITNIHRTKCKDALILDKDSVHLYAQIDTADSGEKWLFIAFEIEDRLGEIKSICSIHQNSINCDFGPCVCRRSDRNIMYVFLNITAYGHLSGAKIKAKAVYPNKTIYHGEEQISEFYDPNQEDVLFNVSHRVINKENCSESFNETRLEATAKSKTTLNVPIVFDIFNTNTGTKTTSVNNVAVISNENKRNDYTLTYEVCNLEETRGQFTCTFQKGLPDTPDSTPEKECEYNKLYFIISVIVNGLLILWIIRSTLYTIFQHICDKLSKRSTKNKMSLPVSVEESPGETSSLKEESDSFDTKLAEPISESSVMTFEDYKRSITVPSNEKVDKHISLELGVSLR